MKRIQQIFQIVIAIFLCIDTAHCDLLDRSLVDGSGAINAPLGTIGKSLTDQISIGRGDLNTPGSSIYLIKRDPARAIRRGRQLFQRKFSRAEGHGPRVNFTASGDVTQVRALGAGLTDSCAACHGRPKGSAGFGGDVATRPDSRDAPHLFGLGLVEMLADEITEKLRHIRQAAIEEAASKRKTIRKRLKAKTIRYGYLTAYPDGSVDTSEVKGVDNDLRIRPFFHHGGTVSIREFIIGAFNDEMGLQAPDSVLCAVTDPDKPVAMISPAGFVYDPDLDSFQRPPVCNPSDDADGDGVGNEIDPALIDYMEFYLLNYFKPGHYKKTRASRKGLRLMKKIGCTSCHKRNLTIENDRRVADVITKYTPEKAIFNGLFSEVIALYEVLNDGEPYPQFSSIFPRSVPERVNPVFGGASAPKHLCIQSIVAIKCGISCLILSIGIRVYPFNAFTASFPRAKSHVDTSSSHELHNRRNASSLPVLNNTQKEPFPAHGVTVTTKYFCGFCWLYIMKYHRIV